MKISLKIPEHFLRREGLTGEGSTLEEALRDAIANVGEELRQLPYSVKVAEEVWLPPAVLEKMPQAPKGYLLVIFATICHSSGETNEWKFVAVLKGTEQITTRGGKTKAIYEPITMISHMDSNSKYAIKLPANSLQYIEDRKAWVARMELKYDY